MTVLAKRCPKCGLTKGADQFHKSSYSKSGLGTYCKACECVRVRTPRKRERWAEYYERNREEILAKNRQWKIGNPEKHRANGRAWWKNNSEFNRDRVRARRLNRFEKSGLKDRWAYYGGKCWMCGALATETDHVKPRSKGGANLLCNLRPICKPCNSAKRDRWPL